MAATRSFAGGRVVSRGDPDYDSKRATFNAMVDRHPLEIHVVDGRTDVFRFNQNIQPSE